MPVRFPGARLFLFLDFRVRTIRTASCTSLAMQMLWYDGKRAWLALAGRGFVSHLFSFFFFFSFFFRLDFFSLIFAYAAYVQQVVRGLPCKRNGVMASVLVLHLEAAGSFLTHFFQCFSFFPFFKCRLYYYLVVI